MYCTICKKEQMIHFTNHENGIDSAFRCPKCGDIVITQVHQVPSKNIGWVFKVGKGFIKPDDLIV